jgi:hypothetical protein
MRLRLGNMALARGPAITANSTRNQKARDPAAATRFARLRRAPGSARFARQSS